MPAVPPCQDQQKKEEEGMNEAQWKTNCDHDHLRVHVALRGVLGSSKVRLQEIYRDKPWRDL